MSPVSVRLLPVSKQHAKPAVAGEALEGGGADRPAKPDRRPLPYVRERHMSEPASGPVRLTKQEVELLECLNGYVTSCRGGGIAWTIDDGVTLPQPRRSRVEWLLDAGRVAWLLELGAKMAATGESPAVFDRAAFLLGWRPDDDEDQDDDAAAPEAGG